MFIYAYMHVHLLVCVFGRQPLKATEVIQWKLKSDTMTQLNLFAYHCWLTILCLRLNLCVSVKAHICLSLKEYVRVNICLN